MLKPSRPTEIILRQGKAKLPDFSKAESMRGFICGQISRYSKDNSPEGTQAKFICDTLLKAYNHFHPETELEVKVKSWKGKSSFEIIRSLDKLVIIKYQRPNKDSEPVEVKTEVEDYEIQALLGCIRRFSAKCDKPIKTKYLAKAYCIVLGIKETEKGKRLDNKEFWDTFFSWRKMHNKFTLMLGALDTLGIISYKGGKTKLLNARISLQEALDKYL